MKHSFLFITLLIVFSFAGCKKNRFKKNEFLDALYTNKVQPEIESSINQLETLKLKLNSFIDGVTNLSDVQSSFAEFYLASENIAYYNLGDISKTYIFSRVYKTSLDTSLILEHYNNNSTFSAEDIEGLANTAKGIYSVEFLLNSSTFQDSINSLKFQNYLLANIQQVENNLTQYQTNWTVYSANFIESESTGVSDSYNIVYNRLIHVLEDIINKRLQPLVESNSNEHLPGHYQAIEFALIRTLLIQTRKIFMGYGIENFNSIYINIRKKNKNLAEEISKKLELLIKETNDYNDSLNPNKTADLIQIESIIEKTEEILILLKLDAADELGIILTFGDSDGD